ncbi:MAG: hypothetical protein IPN50_08070 [Sphingomonadales bacterium]|uniref:hypothetical protein n=1 Tax=Sphingorhabdus sp. TaxID=1902408 RepID=UPI003BAE80EF|nr:hypothetical protein [Sphingomonadales bacterium]MBK9432360.1 hypothetical protein [Sphingomonadales bacterium]MBL0022104.1 hypothetical protein [Sphingomonadales bacterium]
MHKTKRHSSGKRVAVKSKAHVGWFVIFAGFMTFSSACSGSIGVEEPPVEFQCAVMGSALLKPAMSDESVCAMFKAGIDDVVAHSTKAVKTVSNASDRDWIKIDIRIVGDRGASVTLAQKRGGEHVEFPEIAVDVMDKMMGKQELEMLAAQVAQLLSNKVEK